MLATIVFAVAFAIVVIIIVVVVGVAAIEDLFKLATVRKTPRQSWAGVDLHATAPLTASEPSRAVNGSNSTRANLGSAAMAWRTVGMNASALRMFRAWVAASVKG
jgi:hypothetical protein